MKKSLIKIWAINNNLGLLNHTEERNFKNKITHKDRNVSEQLIHFHNTRLNELKVIVKNNSLGIIEIDKPSTIHKLFLIDAFKQSSNIISFFSKKVLQRKMKNHPSVFLPYSFFYEISHRKQVSQSYYFLN